MDNILKITSAALSKIMAVIKGEIQSRDNKILTAALTHHTIYSENEKQAGEVYYNSTEGCYYFYTGLGDTKITLDNLIVGTSQSTNFLFKQPSVIPDVTYNIITPFTNAGTYFQTVAKHYTVGAYTKWVLIPKTTLAAGTYKIGTSSNANYYGTFTITSGKVLVPWEVWLPATFATGSVVVSKA